MLLLRVSTFRRSSTSITLTFSSFFLAKFLSSVFFLAGLLEPLFSSGSLFSLLTGSSGIVLGSIDGGIGIEGNVGGTEKIHKIGVLARKFQSLSNYRLVWFLVQKPLVLLVLLEVVLEVLI